MITRTECLARCASAQRAEQLPTQTITRQGGGSSGDGGSVRACWQRPGQGSDHDCEKAHAGVREEAVDASSAHQVDAERISGAARKLRKGAPILSVTAELWGGLRGYANASGSGLLPERTLFPYPPVALATRTLLLKLPTVGNG